MYIFITFKTVLILITEQVHHRGQNNVNKRKIKKDNKKVIQNIRNNEISDKQLEVLELMETLPYEVSNGLIALIETYLHVRSDLKETDTWNRLLTYLKEKHYS